MDKIVVDYIIDLIIHPYYILLEIKKLDPQTKNLGEGYKFLIYMTTKWEKFVHRLVELFISKKP